MFKKIRETFRIFSEADLKTLKEWKIVGFISIGVNLFFLYWYLEWKKLALALLIVNIFFLAIIMWFEREKTPITEDKSNKKESPDKKNVINNFMDNLEDAMKSI